MRYNYLESVKKQFSYYKLLGEKTIAQVPAEKLFWKFNEASNSIAIIVNHLHGNMLSRWTDFLVTDGEKPTRNRDLEFENEITTTDQLFSKWNKGWNCLFQALDSITDDQLEQEIFIRNQGHTVMEAINRQLAHYPYHIAQIVFIGKMICGDSWSSLSIPKGASEKFNKDKFSHEPHKEHFTDETLDRGRLKN